MGMFIAVDIGGTQLRAAIYPLDSLTPLPVERIPTKDPSSSTLERLESLIETIWPADVAVSAIGVAAPGAIDPYQGVLLSVANIQGWENLPLRQILEKRFQTPVGIGNDANLAALGEWQYGAGQGHHHLIYLTISTGIGGGVIIDDRLLLGHRGLATELGHVVVMQEGPLCSCGKRGHLESVASGPAIASWVEGQLSHGVPPIFISKTPDKQNNRQSRRGRRRFSDPGPGKGRQLHWTSHRELLAHFQSDSCNTRWRCYPERAFIDGAITLPRWKNMP